MGFNSAFKGLSGLVTSCVEPAF